VAPTAVVVAPHQPLPVQVQVVVAVVVVVRVVAVVGFQPCRGQRTSSAATAAAAEVVSVGHQKTPLEAEVAVPQQQQHLGALVQVMQRRPLACHTSPHT
jgi:hypothetical protein